MLINKIKEDISNARKSRNLDKVVSLSTVIGELERVGKDANDDKVIKTLRSNISSLNFSIRTSSNPAQVIKLQQEKTLLEKYLPLVLTESELTSIIIGFKNLNPETNLREIMDFLRKEYPGQYDGAIASKVAMRSEKP